MYLPEILKWHPVAQAELAEAAFLELQADHGMVESPEVAPEAVLPAFQEAYLAVPPVVREVAFLVVRPVVHEVAFLVVHLVAREAAFPVVRLVAREAAFLAALLPAVPFLVELYPEVPFQAVTLSGAFLPAVREPWPEVDLAAPLQAVRHGNLEVVLEAVHLKSSEA
ncbi:hypothetical protein KRP22_004345 [Phytophthora ramorum]|nr:hypothetical protein KRP22_13448 [Phytophthora ramorum]